MKTQSAHWLMIVLALWAVGCAEDTERRVVGTLERDRIELIAEAREPIIAVHVHEGEHVEADQLLLELDGSRLAAQVDGARGARDRAAARLA